MVSSGDVSKLLQEMGFKLGELDEEIPLVKQGLDSLDVVTLVLEVEKTYGVKVPQDKVETLRSLKSIADFLNGQVAAAKRG